MSVEMIDHIVDEHNIEIDSEKIKRVKVSENLGTKLSFLWLQLLVHIFWAMLWSDIQ